jgi:hypothetical protein
MQKKRYYGLINNFIKNAAESHVHLGYQSVNFVLRLSLIRLNELTTS